MEMIRTTGVITEAIGDMIRTIIHLIIIRLTILHLFTIEAGIRHCISIFIMATDGIIIITDGTITVMVMGIIIIMVIIPGIVPIIRDIPILTEEVMAHIKIIIPDREITMVDFQEPTITGLI
jgi:hypothetical protein